MVIFSFIIYDIWKKNCEIHINLEIQLFEIIMHQVVILMVDTQRKDMVGCYGNPDMHTPNLDHLAESGIRFERAYCCQPVCGPARAGLFTGTFPHSNGSWGNSMPPGITTKSLGERLHDRGIHTAYIGKWHVDGGDYFGMGRCPSGWDPAYWYDMRNYMEELEEDERFRSRITAMINYPGLTSDFLFGHRCAIRAVDFIEQNKDQDFLLVVSFDEPHGPSLCPAPYSTMFKDYEFPVKNNVQDTLEGKPVHQRIWAGPRLLKDRSNIKIKNQSFFGCNAYIDSEIGRIIDVIDNCIPDALVIYTSDHGDLMESHCLSGKGPAMYEEITNIPFIMRWPSVAPAGTISGCISISYRCCPNSVGIFQNPPFKDIRRHESIAHASKSW